MTPSPRVVFDTNIFIRAFLSPLGPAGKCLELVQKKELILCLSDDAFSELEEVIDRPHIRNALRIDYSGQRECFLDSIRIIGYFTVPIETPFDLPRDPDDEFVISLALSSDADFVISYDRDLLDLMTGFDDASKDFRQRFRHLKIVRPDEFLKIISETKLTLAP